MDSSMRQLCGFKGAVDVVAARYREWAKPINVHDFFGCYISGPLDVPHFSFIAQLVRLHMTVFQHNNFQPIDTGMQLLALCRWRF